MYVSGIRVAAGCRHTKGILELVNAIPETISHRYRASTDSTKKAHSAAVTDAIPLTVQNKYVLLPSSGPSTSTALHRIFIHSGLIPVRVRCTQPYSLSLVY